MPSVGTAATGKRRPSMSEDAIHRAVIGHLNVRARKGCIYWHTPNGGARGKTEAARFVGLGVKAGIPDLVIIMGGEVYGLELKADKGRVTPIQRSVHDQMREAGATVAVAFGLDDALAQLLDWKVLKC